MSDTWCYCRDGSSVVTTYEEADKLVSTGDWAYSPAEFSEKPKTTRIRKKKTEAEPETEAEAMTEDAESEGEDGDGE